MNLLFAGGYDTKNLGDYASLLALKKLFKDQGINTTIKVLSRHPNDGFSDQLDVETLYNFDYSSKQESLGNIFRGFNYGDDSHHLSKIYTCLQECDALVIGNGRLLIDITLGFMKGPLAYFAALVLMAKMMGKPVIIFSMTLVDVKTQAGKEHLSFILNNSDLLLLREESSKKICLSYRSSAQGVYVLPDVAFALDRDDADTSLTGLGIDDCLAVNFRSVRYDGEQIDQYYTDAAKLSDRLIRCSGKGLLFCNQATYNIDTQLTDDRYSNSLVFDRLSPMSQSKATLIQHELTIQKTLGLYQSVGGLVTTRRHGFIMALTQGCPAYLICEEENTRALSETVPHRSLYVSGLNAVNDINFNDYPDIYDCLYALRKQCLEYPEHILRLLS